MSNALELKGVNIFYGSVQVVYNLSMEIEVGKLVYLMGRNGAGKTTTMKSIIGIIPPRSGSIKFEGNEVARKKPFELAKLGIGFVPDDRRIFPFLTVKENLEIFSEKKKNGEGWTLGKVHELFPVLKEKESIKGGHLSGGEQEMLAVARALMRNPKVLLLDEPFEGLAPLIVANLSEVFESLKGYISILLVGQNVKPCVKIVDKFYLMDRGVIKAEHHGGEIIDLLGVSA